MAKKQKPDFHDIEKVMRELVMPFYNTERSVPLPIKSGRRPENDAEHSWTLAFVACMLAGHIDPKLDVGLVCQYAIVHDLTEVHAGDTSAFAPDEEHQTKEEREHAALVRISKDFAHLPWLVTRLQEYERQDTEEARFVRSVDKIIPLFFDYLTEGVYYKENKHTLEEFLAFMQRPREKAKVHPGAFAYHEEAMAMMLARPDFFHSGKKPKK